MVGIPRIRSFCLPCHPQLTSVKGIATTSALELMAELLLLPKNLQPAQWVAQAGLDPRPRESGTAIHKPRFISKTGNKYLRKRFARQIEVLRANLDVAVVGSCFNGIDERSNLTGEVVRRCPEVS